MEETAVLTPMLHGLDQLGGLVAKASAGRCGSDHRPVTTVAVQN